MQSCFYTLLISNPHLLFALPFCSSMFSMQCSHCFMCGSILVQLSPNSSSLVCTNASLILFAIMVTTSIVTLIENVKMSTMKSIHFSAWVTIFKLQNKGK
uniref:Uncharacterized protein n=1 Tax=Anguilla anguilla TaxID=7936 RepID=A0A0E9X8Y8_ANGAN